MNEVHCHLRASATLMRTSATVVHTPAALIHPPATLVHPLLLLSTPPATLIHTPCSFCRLPFFTHLLRHRLIYSETDDLNICQAYYVQGVSFMYCKGIRESSTNNNDKIIKRSVASPSVIPIAFTFSVHLLVGRYSILPFL